MPPLKSTPHSPAPYPLKLPSINEQLAAAIAIAQKRLNAGFETYFAGGWVRDCILGKPLNDIDLATRAPPKAIEPLFPKTHSIGAHFGCVIVVENGWNFEVTSFRRDGAYLDGRHPSSCTPGSAREDAERRDFTVNGLFYDLAKERVLDFVGGLDDLRAKRLCCIGDPYERFAEDKLRVLRCARLAAQLGFTIEEKTAKAATHFAKTLRQAVSKERIWAELEKIAQGPDIPRGFTLLFQLHLGRALFSMEGKPPMEQPPPAVTTFAHWPANTPLIYYLLSFWSSLGTPPKLEEDGEVISAFLSAHFPLTKLDRRRITLWCAMQHLALRDFPPNNRSSWCALLADSLAEECFEALSALSDAHFAHVHRAFRQTLTTHILRRRNQTPLVTASHLRALGIAPGIEMGKLLKRTVQIAESRDLQTSQEVLHHLFEPPRSLGEDGR